MKQNKNKKENRQKSKMKHSIMLALFWYYSPNMARRDWRGSRAY